MPDEDIRRVSHSVPFMADESLRKRTIGLTAASVVGAFVEYKWGWPALWHHDTARTFFRGLGATFMTGSVMTGAFTYIAPEDQIARKKTISNTGKEPLHGWRKGSVITGAVGATLIALTLIPSKSDGESTPSKDSIVAVDSGNTVAEAEHIGTAPITPSNYGSFQYNYGNPIPDGTCYYDTPFTKDSNVDEAKEFQDALRESGYDPGPSDGVIGRQTGNAFSAVQESWGMPHDQAFSPDTKWGKKDCYQADVIEQMPAFEGAWEPSS